jgi:hypothetical protein
MCGPIQFILLTCYLKSPKANNRVSTSKEKKQNTQKIQKTGNLYHLNNNNNNNVMCMSDYRRGLDWWLHLLTALPHNSQLHVVTAPPLSPHFKITAANTKSSSWLRPVCGDFHNLIRFNCAPFFASCRRHRVLTVTCLDGLDACRCAAYIIPYCLKERQSRWKRQKQQRFWCKQRRAVHSI